MSIRILIVDDHPVVRYGLRALLATQPDMQVLGEAADGDEAVAQALVLQPDVVLLDLAMPRKDGVDVIRALKAAGLEARILVLTSFASDDHVFSAIRAGALGYLLKDTPHDKVLQAIRDVYGGEITLHPAIARQVIGELKRPAEAPLTKAPLTTRELVVLKLLAQGLSNQQIAQQLFISEHTVNNHVSNILKKLHLANRTQAALYVLHKPADETGE